MTPDEIRFYYFPAFFCSFADHNPSPTCVKLWLEHPARKWINYDRHKTITVDLGKVPGNSDIRNPNDIEADDHANSLFRGYTSVGPHFPHAYSSGGVYLSKVYIDEHIDDICNALSPDEKWKADVLVKEYPDFEARVLRARTEYGELEVQHFHAFYHKVINPTTDHVLIVAFHPGSTDPDGQEGVCPGVRAPRKFVVDIRPPVPTTSNEMRLMGARLRDQGRLWAPDRSLGYSIGYLERDFAAYDALLDVPKKPSGTGEPGFVRSDKVPAAAPGSLAAGPLSPMATSMKPALAAESRSASHGVEQRAPVGPEFITNSSVVQPMPVDMVRWPRPNTPIHVFGTNPAGEVGAIARLLEKSNCLELKVGASLNDQLLTFERDYGHGWNDATAGGRESKYLDLIGHSRNHDGILKLGGLALTPRSVRKIFTEVAQGGVLGRLGISTVRLLGCRTAVHPRARQAVRALKDVMQEFGYSFRVFASRTDLFAAHFDDKGFRSLELLADDAVVTGAGPGDPPPGDDYPVDVGGGDESESASPPVEFSMATLSKINDSVVSAHEFLFWGSAVAEFQQLRDMLHPYPVLDDPLIQADIEVFVSMALKPNTGDDYRSFDVLIDNCGEHPPRVRVHSHGQSYAFLFKAEIEEIRVKASRWFGYSRQSRLGRADKQKRFKGRSGRLA